MAAKDSYSTSGWLIGAVKAAVVGFALLTGTAVVIGSLPPKDTDPTAQADSLPIPLLLNAFEMQDTASTRFLDPETGVLRTLALPPKGKLDRASCSPWNDSRGGYQVAGTWESIDDRYGTQSLTGVELVRIHQPDGSILNRVEMPSIPTSRPAWVPGSAARILYTALDGRIYSHDFEPRHDQQARSRPEPLRWDVPGLDTSRLVVHGIETARGNGIDGYLVFGVVPKGLTPNRSPLSLWWGRLDPSGRTIIAAGPIFDDGRGGETDHGRLPVVFNRDGGPCLAYLRPAAETGWTAAIVPLEVDDASLALRATEPIGQDLPGGNCLPIPPAPVDGGRRLVVLQSERDNVAGARPVGLDLPGSPQPMIAGTDRPWSIGEAMGDGEVELVPSL